MRMHLAELLADLYDWGLSTQGILAIGLVGSFARGDENAGSDIDFVVIAKDPSLLLDDVSWIRRFGALESSIPEDYGLVQSLRCWSREGVELEFGITTEEWCTPPIDSETSSVINDGIRVVFDPDKRLENAIGWVSQAARR